MQVTNNAAFRILDIPPATLPRRTNTVSGSCPVPCTTEPREAFTHHLAKNRTLNAVTEALNARRNIEQQELEGVAQPQGANLRPKMAHLP